MTTFFRVSTSVVLKKSKLEMFRSMPLISLHWLKNNTGTISLESDNLYPPLVNLKVSPLNHMAT